MDEGGEDSAPSAHDYFDASLAACKALTAVWFARRNGIPLERVESHVERDAGGVLGALRAANAMRSAISAVRARSAGDRTRSSISRRYIAGLTLAPITLTSSARIARGVGSWP